MRDLLLIVLSFLVAFALFPYFIRKFKEEGVTVDINGRDIPTEGGLVVIIIYFSLLSIFSLFGFEFDFIPVSVLALYAVFGLFYDLFKMPPKLKIAAPLLFSFPLVHIMAGRGHSPLYLYIFIPVVIMVTANLVHLYSETNGMPVYTSLIVLMSLIAIAFKENDLERIRFILPLVGVSLAFSYYNSYPTVFLQGNIGSMLGSSLGIVMVLLGLEFIGFVMMTPHLVNFLIYLYWRIMRVPSELHGRVREDGTLEVTRPLSLKWLLPYYFRVTEEKSILSMYLLTALFCSAGILLELSYAT